MLFMLVLTVWGPPEHTSDGANDNEPLLKNEQTSTGFCRADFAHIDSWQTRQLTFSR